MREHQIVITLKPEQFLEVQRMARVAGAKSMGMFVRQQLLTALGIEGSAQLAKAASGADTKRIASELRRLHGELKVFVAESLANTYIGQPEPEAEPEPAANEGVAQSPPVGEGLPLLGADTLGFGLLGAAGPPGLLAQSMVEDAMADFDHARDDLENIAQRAFAISPRLGAMEDFKEPKDSSDGSQSPPSPGRDPLDELLEDPLMKRLDNYVSESASAEQAALASPEDGEPEEEEEVFDVTLPMPEKTGRSSQSPKRKEPPPPPPPAPGPISGPSHGGGFSGGPPPRKRQ